MTPDELAEVGRALYGERWQTQLSYDLQVSDRTIRRWLARKSPIPGEAEARLRGVLEKRLAELGGIVRYTVNPSDHRVYDSESFASFEYDNAGEVNLLHRGLAETAAIPLIERGAKEAVRRHHESRAEFVWLHQSGRPAAIESLHGFLRGSVTIPADFDLTAPVVDKPFDAESDKLHR